LVQRVNVLPLRGPTLSEETDPLDILECGQVFEWGGV
jgi:hypothetical protein